MTNEATRIAPLTEEERELVNSLTPAQRKQLLIEGAQKQRDERLRSLAKGLIAQCLMSLRYVSEDILLQGPYEDNETQKLMDAGQLDRHGAFPVTNRIWRFSWHHRSEEPAEEREFLMGELNGPMYVPLGRHNGFQWVTMV